MITWLVVLFGILASPSLAWAGDEPSFYVYHSDTLTVHVANVADIGGVKIALSDFAPRMGQGYAERHNVTTEYLALPLIFSEDPKGEFVVEVGRRTFKPAAIEVHLSHGRWYGLAIFEKRFRLKEITGFRYRGAELVQESKLR